jgi:hypothetical protein
MGAAIAENLISDVITAAIGVLATYLLLRRANRGLAGLLGASADRRILIVLPRIQIAPGGTVGEYRRQGYVGPAVARSEFEAAVAARDALADPLGRLLARRRSADASGRAKSSGPVEATVMAPARPDPAAGAAAASLSLGDLPSEFTHRSLLLLGGPVYNVFTRLAFEHSDCQMTPEVSPGGEWGMRVKSGPQQGQFFTGRDTGTPHELGIIQAFRLGPGDGPTVTVCAGTGDLATFASVDFLLGNWRKIRKHCRDRPYAVLLSVAQDTGEARWMGAICDGQPFVL